MLILAFEVLSYIVHIFLNKYYMYLRNNSIFLILSIIVLIEALHLAIHCIYSLFSIFKRNGRRGAYAQWAKIWKKLQFREATLFASRPNINDFWFFFRNGDVLNGPAESRKFFSLKSWFLATVELYNYFSIFSSLWRVTY